MQTTPSATIRSHSGTLGRASAGALSYATWNAALVLLICVFVLRMIYLIALCPYELVGDEAYYWEQARHLDWCYHEKGPALPWMIAACCKVFGDHEWVVRLPVAISSLLAGWGIGRLAMEAADGDERVGFFAVVCFCLLPAFQANAPLCTQDGPLIALWVALTAIGLRLVRRWTIRQSSWADWICFWLLLGIGFLFKQSILLFLPGLAIYWFLDKCAPPPKNRWYAQQVVGVIVFFVIISPMIYWNRRHGWPMLAHTLGHLGVGGDQAGETNKGNPLIWFFSTVGGIVGAFGPAFIVLCIWASRHALRETDPQRWRDRVWLICAAAPSVAFFVLLSLFKPVVASWPLPHLVPLVVLVAELAAVELPRYYALLARSEGLKVETPFHQLWVVLVIYGLIGGLLLSFPTGLSHLPWIGPRFHKGVLSKISGHREDARQLQAVLAKVRTPDGSPPLIVTKYYMNACLYAFYLPHHPTVTTAQKYLGRRSTTFDQWPDTDLANPALRGRTLVLVDGDVPWERALRFDSREPIEPGSPHSVAFNYRGPR